MKMAFDEKIPRSSLVDATIRWFVEGDVMASNQDREFMRQAIKLTRDAGIVNKTGCPLRCGDRQGRECDRRCR